LQAILDNPNASQSIKDYITTYSGQMAPRNGGINGFYGIFDVRASKKVRLYKNHALDLSVDVFNVANLISKTSGTNQSLGNQALYALGIPATATSPAIPAFDRNTQRYTYRVNTAGIVTPSGDPFQLQLGLRYSF
jgi:hypothetical protein